MKKTFLAIILLSLCACGDLEENQTGNRSTTGNRQSGLVSMFGNTSHLSGYFVGEIRNETSGTTDRVTLDLVDNQAVINKFCIVDGNEYVASVDIAVEETENGFFATEASNARVTLGSEDNVICNLEVSENDSFLILETDEGEFEGEYGNYDYAITTGNQVLFVNRISRGSGRAGVAY